MNVDKELETNRSQEFQNLLFLSNAWQAEVIARAAFLSEQAFQGVEATGEIAPKTGNNPENGCFMSQWVMSHESMSQWVNESMSQIWKKIKVSVETIKLGITFILFCLLVSLLPEHARPISDMKSQPGLFVSSYYYYVHSPKNILPRHPWRTIRQSILLEVPYQK